MLPMSMVPVGLAPGCRNMAVRNEDGQASYPSCCPLEFCENLCSPPPSRRPMNFPKIGCGLRPGGVGRSVPCDQTSEFHQRVGPQASRGTHAKHDAWHLARRQRGSDFQLRCCLLFSPRPPIPPLSSMPATAISTQSTPNKHGVANIKPSGIDPMLQDALNELVDALIAEPTKILPALGDARSDKYLFKNQAKTDDNESPFHATRNSRSSATTRRSGGILSGRCTRSLDLESKN